MAQDSGSTQGEGGIASRLRQSSRGRSSFVYIVVGVVALTLTLLLAIIYFSATERERTSPPICTEIAFDEAEQDILRGDVERLTIVYDETPYTPISQRYGPVQAKLDYVDGTCSNLPQGVTNQNVVYTVNGVIAFYNQTTDGQQVEVVYQTSDNLDARLFATPTLEPTETPEPVSTIAPVGPGLLDPTSPPIEPVESPTPSGSPVASPAATPADATVEPTTVVATP